MRISLLFIFHLVIASQYSIAQPVNAVIGDSSWFQAFGSWPDANSPEKLRIQTHLSSVVKKLENSDAPIHLAKRRNESIRLLKEYLKQGEFPNQFNYPSAERRPCFIDDNGRLCAVGHLIYRTAGRTEAERINVNFRFHYLNDIKDQALKQWQENSGLSMRELAMIQPSYSSPKKYYRYRTKKGHFGLRHSSSKLIAIFPRYDALHHDPEQNFFWGRNRKGWSLYNNKARRINRNHYDTVFLWSGKENLNLLTAGKKGAQAFNEDGNLRFELEGIYPKAIAGNLFIAKKGEYIGVFNWEGEEVTSSLYDLIEPIYSRASLAEVLVIGPKRLPTFKVLTNGFWGIISSKGEPIIKAEWDDIKHERGLYIAKSKTLGQRLFKMNGDSLRLTGLQSIEETLCSYCSAVITDNSQGVFNGYSQEWAIEPHKLVTSKSGNAYLIQDEQNKWGLANAQGRMLFTCQFDSVEVLDKYIVLIDSSQMLLTNHRGDSLIFGDYQEIGLLAKNETEESSQFFYAKKKEGLKIFNEKGVEKFQELGLVEVEKIARSLIFIHQADRKILAQFFKKELKLYSHLKIEAMDSISPYFYLYKSKGKVGIAQQFYGKEIDSSNFKPAVFDSLIPIPGPRDFSLYLAQKNGFWGVYNAKLDSIIITIDQVDFYPKKVGESSQWIYFIDADKVWKGYFYTSPKLNYLMPAAQNKLSENYLKIIKED